MRFISISIISIWIIILLSISLLLKNKFEERTSLNNDYLVIEDLSSKLLDCYVESDFIFKKYSFCLEEYHVVKEAINECVPFR